ncbi:MAG: glycosyltransferase family 2 protein [Candidatus Hydrogenedentes bacterium]|nr:glycosyltransferase family 2 protein [Candidatus Hydrogenedentota bacterium]
MEPAPRPILLSFIVIGYNESRNLRACLTSLQEAHLEGIPYEVLYVDGGSQDDSMAIAHDCGVPRVLGGDRRRRAAENRNLGAAQARGVYIQFIDGDMTLDPAWPAAAIEYMNLHDETAVVCGRLEEANQGFIFQVAQLDWRQSEGLVDYCGGCALFRREVFEQAGGFPEDVSSGEEPYLCWRIRNDFGKKIFYLDRRMALHDLGWSGFRDYWKQYARNGSSYIEIASRCAGTKDPLWVRPCVTNAAWVSAYLAGTGFLLAGPLPVQATMLLLAAAVLLRKTLQTRSSGQPWSIAAGYALHTYFSQIPLAFGQLRWLMTKTIAPQESSS